MQLKCSNDCEDPEFRACVDVVEAWRVDEFGQLLDRIELVEGPGECEPGRAWCANCGADVEEVSDDE